MGRNDVKLACRDCKKCTNSEVANFGRNAGRVTAAVMTSGMSELGFLATKTCRQCGHALSLHVGETILTSTNRRFGDTPLSSNATPATPADTSSASVANDPAAVLTQSERSLAKDALQKLPFHLGPGEEVLMVVTGFVVRGTEWSGKPGLLALTNNAVRVIRAKDDPGSVNSFTFGVDDFSVTTQESFMGDTVVIDGGESPIKLTSASKSTSRALPAAVEQARSCASETSIDTASPAEVEAGLPVAEEAPANDVFAQLQKLGDLHAAGILSADEFAAAKARLLDQL
ncbi:MAG: hypothetical protein DI613_14545 [Kocuria rhizophila]|nr:MAG: hypothetical protein DI613_14545 [Kocuria rhizophila]